MLIVLVPFMILSLTMILADSLIKYFPFFAMPECGGSPFIDDFDDYANRAVITYACVETFANFIFFTLMFMTRFVEDEFAISRELRTMTALRFVTSILYLSCLCFAPLSTFTMLGVPEYF